MISRRVSQKPINDDYKRLARYIAAADHEGEKSLMSWCAGCVAEDDYELATIEVLMVQDLNTRTTKEKTYHLMISFRTEDEARLTPEIIKEIEQEFARVLGFEEHQRHCGVHKNTNNLHMHVAYNMIHPEKLTRHEPYRDFIKRDRLCRTLEQKYGLSIDNGRDLEKDSPKLNEIAATVEAHTGQQSFDGYVKERRAQILAGVDQAKEWEQVHALFARHGTEIKPHGNGLIIKDLHGELAIKASSLDRGLSLGNLSKRLGIYTPPSLAREEYNEIETYTAKPLQRDPERGKLYQEYQAGIIPRKMALAELQSQEKRDLDEAKAKWSLEREKIKHQFFGRNRYDLLKMSRLREDQQRLKIKQAVKEKQDAVKKDAPYVSWTAFLRWKASQGNEVALAVLRSKKNLVEPEVATSSGETTREEIRAKWNAQQIELMEEHDVSRKGRRGLQAVAKAHELSELERLTPHKKPLFTGFTSSIDSKGTVFINLASGGSIRDMGNQVSFSAHDETAREAALQYARAKWGKRISLADNILRPKKRELILGVLDSPHLERDPAFEDPTQLAKERKRTRTVDHGR